MDGVLVIDKPAGPTSHDVVSSIKKAFREKKVGHTGTLDPTATGVLPLVLGGATKVARFLSGGDKIYRATLRLGVTTTTLDAAGTPIAERPVNVGGAEVQEAAGAFVGEIEQIPPMYSAKKVGGTRLYELARQGIEVERAPKRVRILGIEVKEVQLPEVVLEVRCSAGTYVRVLARDLGEKLGCGAHLKVLRRLAAGPFTLADALPLERVIEDPEAAKPRIVPVGKALSTLPRIDVPRHIARMIRDGYQLTVADLRTLDTPSFATEDLLGLWVDGGDLIAVARALLASSELPISRRDRQGLKTERVLLGCGA
jgi:tRNA pseudouridine55 synthase